MSYETITYEKIGHKAVITLNRPESMNSFNRAMSNEMVDVWSAVKSDDDVWVTVLTAAGDRAFCVGAARVRGLRYGDDRYRGRRPTFRATATAERDSEGAP